MMPPAGMPRPDDAVATGARRLARVARSIAAARARAQSGPAARASPEPRRVRQRDPRSARRSRSTSRRCCRRTTRARGFDNNADVLGVSPVLLESYLTAAERISALALGDPEHAADRGAVPRPAGRVAGPPRRGAAARHGGRHVSSSRTLPLDGEYQFQVRLFRTNLGTMRGLEYPHQLEISVDGERVHLASFGGDKEIAASSDNPTTTGDDVDGRFTARVPLKAGPRHDHRRVPREDARAQHAAAAELRPQLVRHHRLLGLSAHRRGDPHRAVQADRRRRHAEPAPDLRVPARQTAAEEEPCARRILVDAGAARLSRRRHAAGRSRRAAGVLRARPRATAARFDAGIDLALRRMLASPKFVFRVERDPADVAAGRRLPPVAISSSRRGCRSSCGAASRTTSCSTWRRRAGCDARDARAAGAPDARRPEVAGARRQLRRPVAAAAQPAQQAAELARVPRLRRQPARGARRPRLELFFASIVREDRSVLDLMTADYTFVNERLAQALRHPGHLRQPLPPRDAAGRRAAGPARQGRAS